MPKFEYLTHVALLSCSLAAEHRKAGTMCCRNTLGNVTQTLLQCPDCAALFIYPLHHLLQVVLCQKRHSHDWGACPYAHEKEKARRRDPQTCKYSSCICPNASKGECPNGLNCPYAHTVSISTPSSALHLAVAEQQLRCRTAATAACHTHVFHMHAQAHPVFAYHQNS